MREYRLPYDTRAPATARGKVVKELISALPTQRLIDSRLMVTELVANALRHAPPEPGGGIVLEIEREPGVVRIIVRDGGSHMDPNEGIFHTHSDETYGLSVVDTLADHSGFSIDGDKGIWFEVEIGEAEPDALDTRL